jgi:single stranded DNA-binding protein
MYLNDLTIAGHCGNDAITQEYNDQTVVKFNVAVTKKRTDAAGHKIDTTTWFACSGWGRQFTSVAQYIRKGVPLLVQGEVAVNAYKDKNGIQQYALNITLTRVVLLPDPKRQAQQAQLDQQSEAIPF